MLSNSELILSLDALDRLFQASQSPRDSLMHSKHALLEFCGWIEEAQDELLRKCAAKLLDPADVKLVDERIQKNYTFIFGKFRELISLVIGLNKYKIIDGKLMSNGSHYVKMIAIVNSLKSPRDRHAHTHFEIHKATATTLDAPSMLKKKALDVHLGLSELEMALKRHKFL